MNLFGTGFRCWMEASRAEDAVLGVVSGVGEVGDGERRHLMSRKTTDFSSEIRRRLKGLGVVKSVAGRDRAIDIMRSIDGGVTISDLVDSIRKGLVREDVYEKARFSGRPPESQPLQRSERQRRERRGWVNGGMETKKGKTIDDTILGCTGGTPGSKARGPGKNFGGFAHTTRVETRSPRLKPWVVHESEPDQFARYADVRLAMAGQDPDYVKDRRSLVRHLLSRGLSRDEAEKAADARFGPRSRASS